MEIESSEPVGVESIEWTDWTDAIGTDTTSSIRERLHAMGVPRKEYQAAKEVIDQRLAEIDPPGAIARGLRLYDEWREPPRTRRERHGASGKTNATTQYVARFVTFWPAGAGRLKMSTSSRIG